MTPNQQDTDLLYLNGEEYEFSIVLSNPDRRYVLPKILFDNLCVVENLLDWVITGHLDYNNDYEQVERTKTSDTKKYSEKFYYRMDGTDVIEIWLKPTFSETPYQSAVKIPEVKEKMFLAFTGTIYDSQDLSPSLISSKKKRIYFWSKLYNKAIERNTSFSSGEYVASINGSSPDRTDQDRAVPTGTLLKYLISQKLGGTISKTAWDTGGNSIFYTAPATFSLNDSIDLLMDSHVDKDGYPAILDYNRFTDEFQLVSYKTLFDNYDASLKEILSFPDNTNQDAPIGPARAKRNNTFGVQQFSLITDYRHTKMSGMDSIKAITSKNVSWYDPLTKTFKTTMTDNHIVSAKNKFKDLTNKLNRSLATPMFSLNNEKKDNLAIEHRYISGAYRSMGGVAAGLANTLRGALFLNDCIHFSVLGLPIRTPGTFIEIASDKDLQGIWEDRFLGVWLVTDVVHNIGISTYTNDVVAIKPNATEGFDVPEGV